MLVNKEDLRHMQKKKKVWLFHLLSHWALFLRLFPSVPYSHLKTSDIFTANHVSGVSSYVTLYHSWLLSLVK